MYKFKEILFLNVLHVFFFFFFFFFSKIDIFFFFFFLEKIRFDISCESSARQTIHMKCQILFSQKNTEKNKLDK